MAHESRSLNGNRLTVSPMAFVGLPLAEELRVTGGLAADGASGAGLTIPKLATLGWAEAAEVVAGARRQGGALPISYLVTATLVEPDDDDGWATFTATLLNALRFCERWEIPLLSLTSGPSGRLSMDEATARFAHRLTPVTAAATAAGVRLALENSLSLRREFSFTHSVRDAARVAEAAGLGLVVDLFCAAQEHDLEATLRANLDAIEVVQVSDYRVGVLEQPNRWVPGDGDLPLEALLSMVQSVGYAGPIDLELLGPAIEAEGAERAVARGLRWLRAHHP